MYSATSDAIIFLFLGMVLVNDTHEWHTAFVLWVLFLCLVVRFIGNSISCYQLGRLLDTNNYLVDWLLFARCVSADRDRQ